MDISGVDIGSGVRFLVPESGGPAHLFHRDDTGEWCETVIDRSRLTGSFDVGDLSADEPIRCDGGHIEGLLINGQWQDVDEYAREDSIDG